jgi:hypothetical protein
MRVHYTQSRGRAAHPVCPPGQSSEVGQACTGDSGFSPLTGRRVLRTRNGGGWQGERRRHAGIQGIGTGGGTHLVGEKNIYRAILVVLMSTKATYRDERRMQRVSSLQSALSSTTPCRQASQTSPSYLLIPQNPKASPRNPPPDLALSHSIEERRWRSMRVHNTQSRGRAAHPPCRSLRVQSSRR